MTSVFRPDTFSNRKKKGGFVTLRNNMICDVTARLPKEVCHDVRVEPQLLPITGEDLKEATANNRPKSFLRHKGVQTISWTVRKFKHFKSVRNRNPILHGLSENLFYMEGGGGKKKEKIIR